MPGADDRSAQEEEPPWRKLFHGPQEGDKQQQQNQLDQQLRDTPQQQQDQHHPQHQQQQLGDEAPLSELQQQLLACYRKTCLVAGLGLAGAVWRWRAVSKNLQRQIFLPPRAQALPPQLVEQWKQKAQLREALHTVGRQTLLIAGFAGLYFGTELGVGLARGTAQEGDWANTAAAGAVAGGFVGARVPSTMRGRTLALGTLVGGLMGAASGWAQQQLAAYAAAAGGRPGPGESGGGGGGDSREGG